MNGRVKIIKFDNIEQLKEPIFACAVCDELGTHDPTDESAEELIKRIL